MRRENVNHKLTGVRVSQGKKKNTQPCSRGVFESQRVATASGMDETGGRMEETRAEEKQGREVGRQNM